MKKCMQKGERKKVSRRHHRKASLKLKTECALRILAAGVGAVMAFAGAICMLLAHDLAGGVFLSIFGVVFMSLAFGYRQIELVFQKLRLLLRR